MGKEETLRTLLVQSVISYIRENHPDIIDKAYTYFWDGALPTDFLHGTALALGFANFEDWLISDYKVNDKGETFIDFYVENAKDLKEEENALLAKIKDSVLSLYEVVSVSKDKKVNVRDLLLGGEFTLKEKKLTKGLNKGDIFATRLLFLDGRHVMSLCVYPYRASDKKKILGYIEKQFGRYKRNVNPDGTMRDFLKDYGDVLNIAWMNLLSDTHQSGDVVSKLPSHKKSH